jgi:hypothetical protein
VGAGDLGVSHIPGLHTPCTEGVEVCFFDPLIEFVEPPPARMSVRGAVFGVWSLGLGFWIQGLGFKVWDLEFGVWSSGLGVWNLGFGVWGLGF